MIKILSQFFSFGLLVVGLYWKMWPLLRAYAEDRAVQIKKKQEHAASAFLEATDLMREAVDFEQHMETYKKESETALKHDFDMQSHWIDQDRRRKISRIQEHNAFAQKQLLKDLQNSVSNRFLDQVFAYAFADLQKKNQKTKNIAQIHAIFKQGRSL